MRCEMVLEATWSLMDIPAEARDAAQTAARLEGLRTKYKDSTGAPVKLWLEGD